MGAQPSRKLVCSSTQEKDHPGPRGSAAHQMDSPDWWKREVESGAGHGCVQAMLAARTLPTGMDPSQPYAPI